MNSSPVLMHQFLEHTSDGLVVLDQMRRVVVFSKACERITGYTADEMIGREWKWQAFDGDAQSSIRLPRKDGTNASVEVACTPVRDESGAGGFLLGVLRDGGTTPGALANDASSHHDERHNGGTGQTEQLRLDPFLMQVEREAIMRGLRAAEGRRNKAAHLMGISRSRLYRRMEALGIDPGGLRD